MTTVRQPINPETLFLISPKQLFRLMRHYEVDLAPKNEEPTGLAYDRCIRALLSPTHRHPDALIEILESLDDLASVDLMDQLLELPGAAAWEFHGQPTIADVVVEGWLHAPLEMRRRRHENRSYRARTFEYYQSRHPVRRLSPSREQLATLTHALENGFTNRHRGENVEVWFYDSEHEQRFLILHGAPTKCDGAYEHQLLRSVRYCPARFDMVGYDPQLGELRISSCSRWQKALYRREFGAQLFGDREYFPGEAKYSLDPLRLDLEAALQCRDVPGLEKVTLSELQLAFESKYLRTEIHRCHDLATSFRDIGRRVPLDGRIVRASFRMHLRGVRSPRTVTLRPSNVAQYSRDAHAEVIEAWLMRRGFIREGVKDGYCAA